jgi:hypothetical protein
MKKFRIWFGANFLDWRMWRVTYQDGTRTYLLHYSESKGLSEVFNAKLWIDYSASI